MIAVARLGLLLNIAAAPLPLPHFVTPPSLHQVVEDRAELIFETDLPVQASVRYQMERVGGGLDEERVVVEPAPQTQHAILLTQLWPRARVHYRITGIEGEPLNSFVSAGPLVIGNEHLRFAVVGDTSDPKKWERLSRAILADKPEFMVMTGDLIPEGSRNTAADWREFYRTGAPLFAEVPVFTLPGSYRQDAAARGDSEQRQEKAYLFSRGSAFFAVLDSTHQDFQIDQTRSLLNLAAQAYGAPLFCLPATSHVTVASMRRPRDWRSHGETSFATRE